MFISLIFFVKIWSIDVDLVIKSMKDFREQKSRKSLIFRFFAVTELKLGPSIG